MRMCLNHNHALRGRIHLQPINRAPGNYKIIAWSIWDVSEHSLQNSGPVMHKDEFIAIRVFKEVIHLVYCIYLLPDDICIT